MTSGNTVRLDFHSSLEMLDFIQMVSDHIGRMAGLDDDSLHWVSVAVRESVINAITHGNSSDMGKRVHVEFTALETGDRPGIAIHLRDEGRGLAPGTLCHPRQPRHTLSTPDRRNVPLPSRHDRNKPPLRQLAPS